MNFTFLQNQVALESSYKSVSHTAVSTGPDAFSRSLKRGQRVMSNFAREQFCLSKILSEICIINVPNFENIGEMISHIY